MIIPYIPRHMPEELKRIIRDAVNDPRCDENILVRDRILDEAIELARAKFPEHFRSDTGES